MRRHSSAYVTLIAFTAAIGGLLLGFDSSVISGAAPFYKNVFGLEDGSFLFGFSVSCLIWGCIFGNFFAGPLSDRIGRKATLLIAAFLFIVSSLITAFAGDIMTFIAGRILAGVGVGFAILAAPVYIAEVAPSKNRGWMVSFNQLLIVIGLSSAYFVNYFILKWIDDPLTNWRWMLGVEAIPSVIYFCLLLFLPESPRWLVLKGKKEKALAVLGNVGGEAYAGQEYENIVKSINATPKIGNREQFKELFSPKMRLILIIGIGLGIFQQVSGINSILYYAPTIFELAGSGRDAAFVQAIAIGIVFMVVTIASMLVIDRLGRKPLLYVGVSLMAVSLLITGICFEQATYRVSKADIHAIAQFSENRTQLTNQLSPLADQIFTSENDYTSAVKSALTKTASNPEQYVQSFLKMGININSTLVLISILGFIAGFSFSLGPVMWAMFSEIFPNRLRGIAISFVGTVNSFTSFLVATVFPVQLKVFGSSFTFYMYAAFMLLCLLFVWKYVVETKGKSLEALEKYLTR